MSTTTHHLSDETLQDYAAGSLDLAMETLVACHLTMCGLCRARSAFADSVGGALLDGSEATTVAASVSDILSRDELAEEPVAASGGGVDAGTVKATRDVARPASGVPLPLARLLPTDLDDLEWRRVAPGIRQFNLGTRHRRHGAFKLLHLSPGVTLSGHGHTDRELTYVVRGSYTDELGRFCAGDIADLDDHDNHRPVVDAGEPCIALIATHSPVRFRGVVGRIMQPFVGI